jgi:hypothetical protein
MGSIREVSTGRTQLLEPEHVVGRAPMCALRLGALYVSAQQALLRWTRQHWALKDLGSSNGTFLDGSRIKPGDEHTVRKGSKIAFGSLDEEWDLVDESPPPVMAIPVGGGDPVLLEGDLLAVPSSDDPRVTIYRAPLLGWLIERPDDSILGITNHQIFECAGSSWRFCCTEDISPTSRFDSGREMAVQNLGLSFSVSRDEEYVQIHLNWADRTIDLGARTHNYLLLTLARRRLADARDGHLETACGWIDYEDFSNDPRMSPPLLNIDVFRIRRQFATIGVVDAANIIERRPPSRQLRIGTGRLTLATL